MQQLLAMLIHRDTPDCCVQLSGMAKEYLEDLLDQVAGSDGLR